MQNEARGIINVSPDRDSVWQYSHGIFSVPACSAWLKGTGCTGPRSGSTWDAEVDPCAAVLPELAGLFCVGELVFIPVEVCANAVATLDALKCDGAHKAKSIGSESSLQDFIMQCSFVASAPPCTQLSAWKGPGLSSWDFAIQC
jgi:hypothetical protein